MKRLYYMAVESYQTRSTGQLVKWSLPAFRQRFDVVVVDSPFTSDLQPTASIYDPRSRFVHATVQINQLIGMLEQQSTDEVAESVVYFDDMYHPGIDGLLYYCSLRGVFPKMFVRCLAQSIDPDDFIHRTGMAKWMRHYERMLCASGCVSVICTNAEMATQAIVAGWDAPLYNVGGLTFDSREVKQQAPQLAFGSREPIIAWASRLDTEKQPLFFLEVLRRYREQGGMFKAIILSGRGLTSNSTSVLKAIEAAERDGLVEVHDMLSKQEYYTMLGQSRVLFNCALQDWTSWTALEAAAMGTNHCFPAFRSFLEVFGNDSPSLYQPWNVHSATQVLHRQLQTDYFVARNALLQRQDQTIYRIADILCGLETPIDVQSYRSSFAYGEK